MGITVFLGFFLLDALVINRFSDVFPCDIRFDFVAEYNRFLHCDDLYRVQMLLNVIAFVPFGLLVSEFLSASKTARAKCRVGLATLIAFGFSLCIESLQLFLRLGVFELSDLAMNALGGFIGAVLALLGRTVFGIDKFFKSNGY